MELWLLIFSCVLAILAAVLNGFVLYIILSRAQLQNTANWLVLSLAVADMGFGLSYIPALFVCNGHFVDCMGKSPYVYVVWLFLTASITNLCCVVADRYVCIVRPLRYPELVTKKNTIVLMSLAWATAFSLCLVCALSTYSRISDRIHQVLSPIWLSMFFALPSIFLTVTTGHAIYVSRKLSRQRAVLLAQINFNHPREPSVAIFTAENDARRKTSTMIMSTVACCFIVCYSVDSYIYLCDSFNFCRPFPGSKTIGVLLLLINSALNPIAYSFFKKDIKSEVKRVFCSSAD